VVTVVVGDVKLAWGTAGLLALNLSKKQMKILFLVLSCSVTLLNIHWSGFGATGQRMYK
jgi:hypothetical protein